MTQTARIYQFPNERDGRQARARRSPLRRPDSPECWRLVSSTAMDWAWTQPVDGPRLLVLLALAKRVRPKSDQATPSMPELVQMTGMSETTIRGHVQALAKANVIEVDVSNGGRHQRSVYTLPGVLTPRELWGSKPIKTPREATPKNPETPRIPRSYPSAAAPVGLRPKREQEVGSDGDAAAPPAPTTPGFTVEDGGMFEEPVTPASLDKKRNNLAQAITNSYQKAEPFSNRPAVLGVIRKAVDSQRYSGEEINAAALRIAADKRSLTVETLRIELDGFTPRRQTSSGFRKPSTDDKRAAVSSLVDEVFDGPRTERLTDRRAIQGGRAS